MSPNLLPPTERVAGPSRVWRGFTLIELLVSMAVLTLVMVITAQLVGRATSITSASNKFFDTAAMARTVFDRLGDDIDGASLSGGATMLAYTGSPNDAVDAEQNSALGFVCKSRARKIGNVAAAMQDVRGVLVGYKIRQTAVAVRPGVTLNIPVIARGDAEFTYLSNGDASYNGKYFFSVWNAFGTGSTTSLPKDLSQTVTDPTSTADASLLTWFGYGDGVLRFHVSFVLDDGRIVQSVKQAGLDAYYNDFLTNGGTGNCRPVAFTAAASADANKRYVTGLIVGIVVLDLTTLRTRVAQDAAFLDQLNKTLARPVNNGETPMGIWQANLSKVTPLPVEQSIRFYQRYYPVKP